jgi:hypothetical protein
VSGGDRATGLQPLAPPHTVEEAGEGVELVRFWVSGGVEHVALNVGAMGETEQDQWGMILADLSVHVIKGLQRLDPALRADDARARIEAAYRRRLEMHGVWHEGGFGRLN